MRGAWVVLGLVACSEYDMKDPLDADLPGTANGGDGGGAGGGDGTAGGGGGGGGGGGTSTTGGGGTGGDGGGGTGQGGPPDDELLDDECYAPEFGFETSPAARLVTTDAFAPITVTLTLSDTAYDDRLQLDAPVLADLVDSWSAPMGTFVELGPYAVGTELVFAIDVLTTGDHWQSGPSSRNADGVAHVAVTYEGDCTWLMGFEDLYGGGDLDYNDVVFRVEGLLIEE